jgi:hypothetical protein
MRRLIITLFALLGLLALTGITKAQEAQPKDCVATLKTLGEGIIAQGYAPVAQEGFGNGSMFVGFALDQPRTVKVAVLFFVREGDVLDNEGVKQEPKSHGTCLAPDGNKYEVFEYYEIVPKDSLKAPLKA